MDLENTLEESRQMKGPLGAIAFAVLRGLAQGGASPADVADVRELMTRCFQTLDDGDVGVLVDVVKRRLAEGDWNDSAMLVGRLTEAEAHILHDALVARGVDTHFRNEHGDLPNPGLGVELWVRPHDLAAAKAHLSKFNEAHEDRSVECAACGETSLAHFASCWSCGATLESA